MKLKLLILFLVILLLIYGLWTIDYGLVYAQEKLEVQGDLEIQSTMSNTTPAIPLRHGLILKPQSEPTAPASPANEGQIYYDGDDGEKMPKYSDGDTWKEVSGGGGATGRDKYVATRIVAASTSIDTRCVEGVCANPKADEGSESYTCDGIDDQAEINKAINEVAAGGGGVVYLLEGTYNITKNATGFGGVELINTSNIALIGTGANTILRFDSTSSQLNIIYAQNANNILISQLRIDDPNLKYQGFGIQFNNVNDSKIDKVWINGSSNIQNNIIISAGSGNVISNSKIEIANSSCILITSSNNNHISHNNLRPTGSHGIYLSSASSNLISANFIKPPSDENSDDGIYIFGDSSYNTVSCNNIQNFTTKGIYLMKNAVSGPAYLQQNIISGNSIGSCADAIWIDESNNNIVSKNNIRSNVRSISLQTTTTNATKNVLSGNIIYNTTAGDGININGPMNLISYNYLDNPSETSYFGINIMATGLATDNEVFGNFIKKNSFSKPLVVGGGRRMVIQKEKMTLQRSPILDLTPENNTIIPHNPTNYIPIKSAASPPVTAQIADGKAEGEILILEGRGTKAANNWIKLARDVNANLLLSDSTNDQISVSGLRQNDILKLIWTENLYERNYWLELAYSDN